jgi:hypothetical protein
MGIDKMYSMKNLIFVCLFSFTCGQSLFGWQSSWNDQLFGTAFLYDKETKSLYITGTSSVSDSKSKCFLISVNRLTGKTQWQSDYTLHTTLSALTSCSSITQFEGKTLVASGFTEEGINSDSSHAQSVGNSGDPVAGFFFQVQKGTGAANHITYLTNYNVQYPQVIEEVVQTDAIVVASYVTNDKTVSLDYMQNDLAPLLQPTFDTFKYGNYFVFTLQQFKVASNGDTQLGWSRLIKTVDDEDCRVHDFIVYKSRIIFVGATAGSGPELGGTDSGTQLDGFVTQIESATGLNWPTNATKRIKSQEGKHDMVHAICVDEPNGRIYLVGSSTGYYGGGTLDSEHAVEQDKYQRFSAFIMKLDINTMDVMWSRMIHTYPSDIHTPEDVHGLGCAVSSDRVYLTGIVKNGGNINVAKSNGKNDIFAACWKKNGVRQWRNQVGTDQDDTLARGHRSVALDENENLMVVGSTRGVMYETKKNPLQSDAFVITFFRDDGSITPFMKSTETSTKTSTSTETSTTKSSESTTTTSNEPYEDTSMTATAIDNSATNKETSISQVSQEDSSTDHSIYSMPSIVLAGIAFGILIFIIGTFLLLTRALKRRSQKSVVNDGAVSDTDWSVSIESKQHDNNVEDLDYDEDKVKEII